MDGCETKLSCASCSDLLSDVIEGRIESVSHQKLASQIASCDSCRYCALTYDKTRSLCHHALSRPAPEAMGERLIALLRERTGQR